MTTENLGEGKVNLIKILESFNRKERFFLIAQALYDGQGKPEFKLSDDFRKQLGDKIGVSIPKDNVFVAMDYHLDWIHASLVLAHPNRYGNGPFLNTDNAIVGNQRDVDLLVGFAVGRIYHLIMVEAKGYASWNNDQMDGKAARLAKIFDGDGTRYENVLPHFALMSRNESQYLDFDTWPGWMLSDNSGDRPRPYHIEMALPSGRRRAERCDESGKASANGGYFHCPID